MAAEIAHLRARLDAWRAAGADRVDPVGFHRLDALARRCESADAALQVALQPRIEALAGAHADAVARKASAATPAIGGARPLAALVAECDARRGGGAVAAEIESGNASEDEAVRPAAPVVVPPQPPALRHARQLWKAVRTGRQLRQSLQKPREDTGPLNSAQLVNRMLQRMEETSPGYLEQLVGYVDVLSELEHWLGTAAAAEPASSSSNRKAAKRPRASGKRS